MKRFIALIGLCLLSINAYAAGPNVATCASAPDGTPFGTTWLPCTPPAVFLPPTSTLIVASLCPPTYAAVWALASKVAATCQVYTNTPNPANPSSNWWPVSAISFGTIPNPPPPPTLPTTGTGTFTITWVAITQNTDGSAATIASYNIFQGTSAISLLKVANVRAPVLKYLTPALPPGTYWFAVDAVDTNGVEGARSAVSIGTVPAACGAAPSTASQNVSCPAGTTGSWTQTHAWLAAAYPTCWTAMPWVPTAAPAGACTPTVTKPTKLIVTCPIPTVIGPLTCPASAL